MTEYQDYLGRWHVANFDHVGQNSTAWYLPARVLGMSISDYVNMLLNEYHVIPIKWAEYDNGFDPVFFFRWPDYKTAHSFLLRVNREARKKNFCIDWK